MRDHWHKHRGFVKAHVAVEVGTLDVLGVITTDERTMDKDVLVPLLDQVLSRGVSIVRVLADGAYDSYGTFDYLNEHGIEAGIKMHKDATTRSRGWSKARPRAVQEM